MNWQLTGDRPIWQRLTEQVTLRILSGTYPAGSRQPAAERGAGEIRDRGGRGERRGPLLFLGLEKALESLRRTLWPETGLRLLLAAVFFAVTSYVRSRRLNLE